MQHPQALGVFPAHLKRLRLERKLTQRELAEKAHMTDSAVTKYEVAVRIPTPDQLRKLADALGLRGPARGVFFLSAGYAPPGVAVMVDGSIEFDFDPDDDDAPIIHGMSRAA
jgi:transcriptional regulator with XRE-family HTH domain